MGGLREKIVTETRKSVTFDGSFLQISTPAKAEGGQDRGAGNHSAISHEVAGSKHLIRHLLPHRILLNWNLEWGGIQIHALSL